MYFIMSGEVEVKITPTPIRLKEGQSFGEIALLKNIERTATVIAIIDCQLPSLASTDFRNLMKCLPNISKNYSAAGRTHARAGDRSRRHPSLTLVATGPAQFSKRAE